MIERDTKAERDRKRERDCEMESEQPDMQADCPSLVCGNAVKTQ